MRGPMKNKWIVIGAVGISVLLGAAGAAGRSYNPMKWIKKSPGPTASEQLAANKEEEKKLTLQLQALLPPRTSLKDACAAFKSLNDCVASLREPQLEDQIQLSEMGYDCRTPWRRRQVVRSPTESLHT